MNFHPDIFIHPLFEELLHDESISCIHTVMIATKPDIIKQAPIYHELKKRGEAVLLIHTGQHYDFNLSGGMIEEFDLTVGVNLGISGSYHAKVAQIISRLGDIFTAMKEKGKTPIPYIHGDTMTAMAAGNAAKCCNVPCVHNEAGIRTLTPKKEYIKKLHQDFESATDDKEKSKLLDWWIDLHMDPQNFEKGSMEPIPEQFNTRCSEPASTVFLASHEVVRDFLLDEGFLPERIFTVGNSIVDATQEAIKKAKNSTIFETYPLLHKGVVRFCIHRRENCENEKRFTALFEAFEKLAYQGTPLLLIMLYATESAIEKFGLTKRFEKLKALPNTIISPVWPQYSDVIAAMMKAKAIVTDSGSMQEECNEMGVPCITLRFGSDRGESFFTGGNITAPPVNGELIANLVTKVISENRLQNAPQIYGQNVSKKCIDVVLEILKKHNTLDYTEEMRIFS